MDNLDYTDNALLHPCEECGQLTERPRFCKYCTLKLVEEKDPRVGNLLLE